MTKPKKIPIDGCKVAVLVADLFDEQAINAIRLAFENKGAAIALIAPHLNGVKNSQGELIGVDHSFQLASSASFDAVFIPGGQFSVEALCRNDGAVRFVKEAYKSGRAIAAIGEGMMLVSHAARTGGAVDGKFRGPGVVAGPARTVTGNFIKAFFWAITKHNFADRPDRDYIVI